MAMYVGNDQANQNFYMGVSTEFSAWSSSFNYDSLDENDIVLFLELDTKVVRYNRSSSGTRSWAVYGADEQTNDSQGGDS